MNGSTEMSTLPELSSEDFKAKIYQSLQGKGILDSMKSQLRNTLATELHVLMGMPAHRSPPAKSAPGRKCLRSQVADSIVAQYLQSMGYEYSLSTFLPEAGLHLKELISEQDMISFLRISPSSETYTELQAQLQKHGNLLEGLLEVVIGSHVGGKAALADASVQVLAEELDGEKSHFKTSIDSKLRELEGKYAKKAEEESGRYRATLEDRLTMVQKDLEAHYKKQLQTEMELFQMRELAKMRQEEKERYRSELAKDREELQQVYHLRLESVKRLEKNNAEAYRRKEKELEASIFSQRQVLLDELNSLRVKEAGLKRQAELDKRAIELERERIKAMSEQMERSLQQMNAQFDVIVKTKSVKAETAVQATGSSQESAHQMSLMEKSLYETKIRKLQEELSEERRTMDGIQGRLTEELSKVDSLRSQLQDVNLKTTSLQKAKDEAELKLAQSADCLQLKLEASHLKQLCTNLEATISELEACNKKQQQAIQQLHSELSQTTPDIAALTEELTQMQEAHHRQVLVLEYDKKQVCKHLEKQVEQNTRLQRRLDEQLLQLKSAQREVEDLHNLLDHKAPHRDTEETQTRRREKKGDTSVKSSKRTPRPGKSSIHHQPHKSVKPLESFAVSSPDISGIRDFTTPTPTNKSVNFFGAHLPFLAESKAAMLRIEKEADELERTYQEFQHRRMTSSAALRSVKDGHSQPRRLQSEEFPSSPKEPFIRGRVTPMDYLKNDPSVSFTDPPHHSTARHLLFSTEDLHATHRAASRDLTLSSRATENSQNLSHRHQAPPTLMQQLPAGFTMPTCSPPPLVHSSLHSSSSPPNLMSTATTTIITTTTSTCGATTVTPILTLPLTSPTALVAAPTRTDTLATPTALPPTFFTQNNAPVVTKSFSPLSGPDSAGTSRPGTAPTTTSATTTTTTITTTITSARTSRAISTAAATVLSTSTKDAAALTVAAAAATSGSLQTWWKSSGPVPAHNKLAPPTTTTGLATHPPEATVGASAPVISAAQIGMPVTSVPTSAMPTSATPTNRTSLDSIWSQQEDTVTKKTAQVPDINQFTSHEPFKSDYEEEASVTVTEVSQDRSEQLTSSYGRQEKEKGRLQEEEEGIDPVMLKYMKLVEEKKKSADIRASKSPVDVNQGGEALSQQNSSIGGDLPSEPDDPFEDW